MARIIQLGNVSSVQTSTFDEAFGEYSEASGTQRRAKRLNRVKEKDEIKTERSTRRIGRKASRKVARVEKRGAKQQAKITKRATAQEMRQDKRTSATEARQGRKTLRKGARVERRDLGQDIVPQDELQPVYENEYDYNQDAPIDNGGNGEYSGDSQGGWEDEGYGDESGGSGDSGNYDDENDEGAYEDDSQGEVGDSEEEGDDDSLDSFNADGISRIEMSDENETPVNITPIINDIAGKIEWNEELIARLGVVKAKLNGEGQSTNEVDNQIYNRKMRIKELQSKLDKYSNYEGEFADETENMIDYSNVSGIEKPTQAMVNRRRKEVKSAVRLAKNKRMRLLTHTKSNPMNGGDVTPVDIELNPKFKRNEIIIPSSSNFAGTGIIGLDNMDDYDATENRIIEMQSNFGGKDMTTNIVGVAIGLGVAGLIIWGLKKYKVI